MREIKITKNDAGQRLDKFLAKALRDMPLSLMYKLIRKKKIKVDRKRAEPSDMLKEGDTLQLFIADEFFPGTTSCHRLDKIEPKLSIVYEDENIMLINKRPGVLVHEDSGDSGDTLITHVKAYLFQKGEYVPEQEQSFAPALCNRIDRNTGGIVIAAKNAAALREVDQMIRNGAVHKYYLCATHGIPVPSSATLRAYLLKDSKNNIARIYDKDPPRAAKQIITKYKVIAKDRRNALLEIELMTGRTHQIRAQMAHIGHPLIGDGKYGINRDDRAKGYKYQALCSYKVRFDCRGDGPLAYLDGKEFSIPKDEIYFTQDFLKKANTNNNE